MQLACSQDIQVVLGARTLSDHTLGLRQAINAETLEQASQEVDYPLPPQSVRPA